MAAENPVDDSEIDRLRAELGRIKAEAFSLQKDHEIVTGENTALKARVSQFQTEKEKMLNEIQKLQAEVTRPKLLPEQLMLSLRDALTGMQKALESPERVGYAVGTFDADIKAGLSVDNENRVFVKLPYPGESVLPDALSTIRVSLKATPQPVLGLVMIPSLIGASRENADKSLQRLGLKSGWKTQESSSPPNTVILQEPEAYAEVPADSVVTLTLAVPMKVPVPNLVGLDTEIAGKVLGEAGLKMGKITSKQVKAAPGTIVTQNPIAGTEVSKGSEVDVVIAAKK
ncbi:MAG: PASTA domain-containing protein [Bacteroidota bacterium]